MNKNVTLNNSAYEPVKSQVMPKKIIKFFAYVCALIAFPSILLGSSVFKDTKLTEVGFICIILYFFVMIINNLMIIHESEKNKNS